MIDLRQVARSFRVSAVAGTVAAVAVANPVAAHTGGAAGGTVDGLLHPLTGPDHLLAMIAVGVVAAVAAHGRRLWVAPAAFLGGMLLGGVAGLSGAALPGAETLIVASVILLGLAIAGAMQGRAPWLLVALLVAGIAHGHAHGAEAPTAANPVLYVGGFLLATASLHILGVGIGAAIRQRRVVQVGVGAATVAAGALLVV